METTNAWQSFVDTGNIFDYLDYRGRMPADEAVQEEICDGSYHSDGAGASGNQV